MSDFVDKATNIGLVAAIGFGVFVVNKYFNTVIDAGTETKDELEQWASDTLGIGGQIKSGVDNLFPNANFDAYVKAMGDDEMQQEWVNSRGTYKKELEDAWYAARPGADRTKDIHYTTGYYGTVADNIVENYFGKKMN